GDDTEAGDGEAREVETDLQRQRVPDHVERVDLDGAVVIELDRAVFKVQRHGIAGRERAETGAARGWREGEAVAGELEKLLECVLGGGQRQMAHRSSYGDTVMVMKAFSWSSSTAGLCDTGGFGVGKSETVPPNSGKSMKRVCSGMASCWRRNRITAVRM